MLRTSEVDPVTLSAVRALLVGAFAPPEFTDDDWEHTLGGLHVLCREDDGELVGHAAAIQRHLLHEGRALRAGYVESVVVREDRRRRGYGSAMMERLERVIRTTCDVGALNSSDMAKPFYATRDWRPWPGQLATATSMGVRPTPGPDNVHVLAHGPIDFNAHGTLVCDWRDGNLW